MSVHRGVLARRIASSMVDWSIEVAGGLLGSYFGVMVAALLVAMRDGRADEMQSSMLSGLGFGFIFWTLSVSFLNRVLIQGLSRASVGKKVFKLELISTSHELDWATVIKRWLVSFVSLNFAGLGYLYMFIDSEGRTLHDLIAHTDVVPIYEGSSMSVESSGEALNLDHLMPTEMIRKLPMRMPQLGRKASLADVIPLRGAATHGAEERKELEALAKTDEKKAA